MTAEQKVSTPVKRQEPTVRNAGCNSGADLERVQSVVPGVDNQNFGANIFKLVSRRRIDCRALVVDTREASRCGNKRIN